MDNVFWISMFRDAWLYR